MKLKEIMEGVKSKTIAIDTCGHNVRDPMERLLEHYEQLCADAAGANDGKWTLMNKEDKMEAVNARMREHFQTTLDLSYENGKHIHDLPEFYCFHCGRTLRFFLDGGKLSLGCYYDSKTKKIIVSNKRCELENPGPFVGKMITTGELVFANFFRYDDSDEADKYTEEWSVNGIAGRRNIAKYKLEKFNVAYGQMSNMSVGVYINETKDSIIIGDPYIYDRRVEAMSEEELNSCDKEPLWMIEGHKKVGTICLDVWRWEAGDKKMLGEMYDEVKKRKYADVVEVKCKPGTWEFTHYYDTSDEDDPVYSRLKLVEPIRL